MDMKTKKRLTQAERVEIVRRLQAGEKQAALAEEFEVSQSTINRVRTQEREKTKAEDPVDTSAKELQKQYWAKWMQLSKVVQNRENLLNITRSSIENDIHICERRAREALTSKQAESFKAEANAYRLRLASLDDLSEFDDKMLDLLTELKSLADVLVKVRKSGMGKQKAYD